VCPEHVCVSVLLHICTLCLICPLWFIALEGWDVSGNSMEGRRLVNLQTALILGTCLLVPVYTLISYAAAVACVHLQG
jgi:hypothetical protein